MNYDKYVLDLTNDSPLTTEELIIMLACALRPINGVDTGIQPMEDTMLDHLEQAREIADSGSEEKRILTEAWNEIAEHQKETGEWYE
jgi:hypothetical protein